MNSRMEREFQGVLGSPDKNRYKYTVNRICENEECYYTVLEKNDASGLGIDTDRDIAAVWSDPYFADRLCESSGVVKVEPTHVTISEFYKKTLVDLYQKGTDVLICPDLSGNGKIVTAKEFRISLFTELWEGEQEIWMFL